VERAAQLTNFVRRPTYITPGLGSAIIGGQTQYFYSEDEKKKFRENPKELHEYRKRIQVWMILEFNSNSEICADCYNEQLPGRIEQII